MNIRKLRMPLCPEQANIFFIRNFNVDSMKNILIFIFDEVQVSAILDETKTFQ